MSLRFAHVSDIHLLDLRGVMPWSYVNKRATGAVNLALNRRRKHDDRLFDMALQRARDSRVDRLVVTGDVTNLSLDPEFALVRHKFKGAGMPVTVIPGNHDAYTGGAARRQRFEHFLGGHMQGERASGHLYPFVQRYNGVTLVAVSTAVATLPLFATGQLGAAQLQRLDAALQHTDREESACVVLIHHPVVEGVSKKRHELLDLQAFGDVIRRHDVDLILHGHEHRMLEGELPTRDGVAVVHGVSAGTSLSTVDDKRAAVVIYTVEPTGFEREVFRWDGATFAPT